MDDHERKFPGEGEKARGMRVIEQRQLALLRELAARTADARTPQQACALAASSLATNPDDVPFALIYLREGESRSLALAGCFGAGSGSRCRPLAA